MSTRYLDSNLQAGVDAFPAMMLRRHLSGIADNPVDFYAEGLRGALRHTTITERDMVMDVGASSGQLIIGAALATGVKAYVVGLDISDEAHTLYMPDSGVCQDKFTFIQAPAESNPLPTSSVRVATAHNVLFRSADLSSMFGEMKRVVEPGGIIAVSTNGRRHAFWRHMLERLVGVAVRQETGKWVLSPRSPAESCYLEDMPDIIAGIGGLAIMDDSVVQSCKSRITEETIDHLLYSIKLTADRSGIAPRFHSVWRAVVERDIRPFIMSHMIHGDGQKPYFPDTIHRGMFIMRNTKSFD